MITPLKDTEIDPDRPTTRTGAASNSLEARLSRRCFNAGYHIFHHVRKGTHYTELATEFAQNREK